MGKSFFIWNNMDSRNMGITLAGPVAIVKPEERVKHVEIPDRAGDLTQLEGENIYNSYIQTANIQVRGGYRVREISKWLRGSGYVTFSGEPDKRQAARVIGAVTLQKHSHNMDVWEGEVQFYCQPLKELLTDSPVVLTVEGRDEVQNNGDVIAKPLWKVTASGSSMSLQVRTDILTVTGVTSGNVYYIDSDAEEVYNSDRTQLLTGNSTGRFPVIKPGNNTPLWTNISKIECDRRERYL